VTRRFRRAAPVWLLIAALAGAASVARAEPTVLFDEGHGQKFLIEGQGQLDLSSFAELFRAAGAQVQSSREPLADTRLIGVDALIVSGPFAPFSATEIEAIMSFLDRGGRLVLMLHIPFPVAPLLHRLGVDFSNGIIRERVNVIKDDPLNFHVTALTPHAVTRDVGSFDVFGAWALLNNANNVTVLAQTSASAWVDLNGNGTLEPGDAAQAFAVAVAGQSGRGRFVVFGDDAIFQNQFLTRGNVVLAKNLATWLTQSTSLTAADPAPRHQRL